jgi:SRSO17 transposase
VRDERCLKHLVAGLGQMDMHAGLKSYCTGLMLPLSRKSVEPMAARVDPLHASVRQSLHNLLARTKQ